MSRFGASSPAPHCPETRASADLSELAAWTPAYPLHAGDDVPEGYVNVKVPGGTWARARRDEDLPSHFVVPMQDGTQRKAYGPSFELIYCGTGLLGGAGKNKTPRAHRTHELIRDAVAAAGQSAKSAAKHGNRFARNKQAKYEGIARFAAN